MKDRKEELLTILQEEAAEVIQAVSKCKRFPGERSLKELETETGDFLGVLKLLIEEGYVNPETIEHAGDAKIKKLDKFMTHKRVK
jgi:NTP pyrophosphatase (non-canonical NTP hydrolase)